MPKHNHSPRTPALQSSDEGRGLLPKAEERHHQPRAPRVVLALFEDSACTKITQADIVPTNCQALEFGPFAVLCLLAPGVSSLSPAPRLSAEGTSGCERRHSSDRHQAPHIFLPRHFAARMRCEMLSSDAGEDIVVAVVVVDKLSHFP
jgi:hypothetical protein